MAAARFPATNAGECGRCAPFDGADGRLQKAPEPGTEVLRLRGDVVHFLCVAGGPHPRKCDLLRVVLPAFITFTWHYWLLVETVDGAWLDQRLLPAPGRPHGNVLTMRRRCPCTWRLRRCRGLLTRRDHRRRRTARHLQYRQLRRHRVVLRLRCHRLLCLPRLGVKVDLHLTVGVADDRGFFELRQPSGFKAWRRGERAGREGTAWRRKQVAPQKFQRWRKRLVLG
mmetsp:Transcript_32302/g.89220  ORF Transcript_32302/g.89220 Transcript_32302/m.89220 type:complete len:226 (+) Transcript_32302:556-1233(+)